MTWKKYLYNSQTIAEEMNLSVSTVETWKSKNCVPVIRFKKLRKVLREMGHKLTPVEMGKLNNKVEE